MGWWRRFANGHSPYDAHPSDLSTFQITRPRVLFFMRPETEWLSSHARQGSPPRRQRNVRLIWQGDEVGQAGRRPYMNIWMKRMEHHHHHRHHHCMVSMIFRLLALGGTPQCLCLIAPMTVHITIISSHHQTWTWCKSNNHDESQCGLFACIIKATILTSIMRGNRSGYPQSSSNEREQSLHMCRIWLTAKSRKMIQI